MLTKLFGSCGSRWWKIKNAKAVFGKGVKALERDEMPDSGAGLAKTARDVIHYASQIFLQVCRVDAGQPSTC